MFTPIKALKNENNLCRYVCMLTMYIDSNLISQPIAHNVWFKKNCDNLH